MKNETVIYGGGRRAGKVFAFCRAMGWSLKPFQKILLTRLMYSKELRAFIPAEIKPWSFERLWKEAHPKKEWHVLLIEEYAYMK